MEGVLSAPAPTLAASRTPTVSIQVVRSAEWIIFAFLLYAPVLAFFVPTTAGLRTRLASLNLVVLLCYGCLVYLGSANACVAVEVIRDWLPLGVVLLAYREIGWFALPHQEALLESRWVVWDRLVLGHGGTAIIESLGPVVPSVLEVAYAFVYALPPLALAVLYLYGQRHRADRFLTVVLLSVLLCYAQFPFWPSEPPRVVFAYSDLPSYCTVFRRFNLWMLGNYGIHTSVFPSAHVAGAFSTAFGFRVAMPAGKRTYRSLSVIAVLIAIATVYGRYHYLADAICGAVIASVMPVLVAIRCANARVSAPKSSLDVAAETKITALPRPSALLVGEGNWHI